MCLFLKGIPDHAVHPASASFSVAYMGSRFVFTIPRWRRIIYTSRVIKLLNYKFAAPPKPTLIPSSLFSLSSPQDLTAKPN